MKIKSAFHPHYEGWGYVVSLCQLELEWWSGACWVSLDLFLIYGGTG